MTQKHAGYYLAPLLMFVSATALGQMAYTPEQTQSDVSWIPWGIAIVVIAAGGFFLVNYFKNKGDSARVSQPQMQPPKAASFPSVQGYPRGSVFIPAAATTAQTLREGFASGFCNILTVMSCLRIWTRFRWESTSDSTSKCLEPMSRVDCSDRRSMDRARQRRR